eukprot:IDg9874t1
MVCNEKAGRPAFSFDVCSFTQAAFVEIFLIVPRLCAAITAFAPERAALVDSVEPTQLSANSADIPAFNNMVRIKADFNGDFRHVRQESGSITFASLNSELYQMYPSAFTDIGIKYYDEIPAYLATEVLDVATTRGIIIASEDADQPNRNSHVRATVSVGVLAAQHLGSGRSL